MPEIPATVTACPNILAYSVQSGLAPTAVINGVSVAIPAAATATGSACFARNDATSPFAWVAEAPACGTAVAEMRKVPGQQGPMDDAYMAPFLVVTPDSTSGSAVDAWVAFELNHLLERWAGLFRGNPRVKKASEVTDEDKASYNLILWGTFSLYQHVIQIL